ncbi:MAG: endonuclease V [candidate division WOR-3 bacterium]|nr:endonuclease V [candidate division WOR-3 bacterium]
MKTIFTHPFDVSIEEARRIQDELRGRVVLECVKHSSNWPETVAGVDVAFRNGIAYAVCEVFSYPQLELLEEKTAFRRVTYPYIPGFLSFREIPVIIDTLLLLEIEPDIILCDGQGIAHPRGMGLASHIGVIFAKPTIGCAKSRLVGEYKEPGIEKGCVSTLSYAQHSSNRGRVVGYVLRTRAGVKPVFVSPGNLISPEDAVKVIIGCTRDRRIPEPLRFADRRSKELKRI